MSSLVFIHGRGQTAINPIGLRDDWISALNQGILRLGSTAISTDQVKMPFYAQLLEERVLLYIERHAVTKRGEAGNEIDDPDFNYFIERAVNQIESLIALDHEPSNVRGRGLYRSKGLFALARLADWGVPEASTQIIKNFLIDAYVYLSDEETRNDVNELVLSKVSFEQEAVFIAHSLGSVIACDILSHLEEEVPRIKLVTLGSPLGLSAVRSKLSLPMDLSRNVSVWMRISELPDSDFAKSRTAVSVIPGQLGHG